MRNDVDGNRRARGRSTPTKPDANYQYRKLANRAPVICDQPWNEVFTRTHRYLLKTYSRITRQWQAVRAALNSAMKFLRYPPLDDAEAVDWVKTCHEPTNNSLNHGL